MFSKVSSVAPPARHGAKRREATAAVSVNFIVMGMLLKKENDRDRENPLVDFRVEQNFIIFVVVIPCIPDSLLEGVESTAI